MNVNQVLALSGVLLDLVDQANAAGRPEISVEELGAAFNRLGLSVDALEAAIAKAKAAQVA